ncbi:IBR domain-containing protein [Cryptosporidium muris RN66]|uniref:RBR-type E3 ubiquitin transferase n=1 Tax=Cryptosporidium muris (strain RN66) TaxID=441375 RepID=B6AET3_CRYMR|nr:IBR domain-containing protein [Cryptosporidium muris RN66]EEA06700.1 IBR domain-containing protein [Cryptosporidium muris RN66]|eukprot:XP_002141049.1 IBR domain-containing protein [Cryptosporidium muris RN66]
MDYYTEVQFEEQFDSQISDTVGQQDSFSKIAENLNNLNNDKLIEPIKKRRNLEDIYTNQISRLCTVFERNFKVLSFEDITKIQKSLIEEAMEILGTSECASFFLLFCTRWELDSLTQEWFLDQDKVLEKFDISKVDAFDNGPFSDITISDESVTSREFYCNIIADTVKYNETFSLKCGHRYSKICWKSYLEISLKEGISCIFNLRCIGCNFLIPREVWKMFLSESDMITFDKFCIRSFVDYKRAPIKWCPGIDCNFALELISSAFGSCDVKCNCGVEFCIYCSNEPHWPIPCKIIAKWNEKNKGEADNISWILDNTKLCPKCKQYIEKNQGCVHMKCRCKFEFCWLCLGDWSKHSNVDVYKCNIFELRTIKKGEKDNLHDNSIERYVHYFERYRVHLQGQKAAELFLDSEIPIYTEKLNINFSDPLSGEFLKNAVLQTIQGRRLIKWTYAYGYFALWKDEKTKSLFEYHQGQLEKTLNILQDMVSTFGTYYTGMNEDIPKKTENSDFLQSFLDYKTRLVDLTRVVRSFFNTVSHALEYDFVYNIQE